MVTPNHYTSHHMLQAAFNFRRAELWNKLEDRHLFAVTLSSGEIGYCIVMGAAGTYYGLGMYRGRKGFSTYLRMVDPLQNEIDAMNNALTFDVISCNFSQANEMNFNIKEPVRYFSKKFEIPIPKKKGWPEFVRYKPFRDMSPVDNEQDGNDIADALFAGVYLSKLLKTHSLEELGFTTDDEYPSRKGGKVIPLLVNDGFQNYHLEKTTLPAYKEFEYPKPKMIYTELTDVIVGKPKRGSLEIGTMSLPGIFHVNPGNMAPFIIPFIQKESGFLSFVMCQKPYDVDSIGLLYSFAEQMACLSFVPSTIICTDGLTACLLRDFCAKTGIELVRKKKSKEFEYALFELLDSMRFGIF